MAKWSLECGCGTAYELCGGICDEVADKVDNFVDKSGVEDEESSKEEDDSSEKKGKNSKEEKKSSKEEGKSSDKDDDDKEDTYYNISRAILV